MPKKIFISYKHEPKEWVKSRLVPCLEAGGAEVLVDYKYFQAGRSVIGEMDKYQDLADLSVLVFSSEYLTSDYCQHEMQRAMARDPDFKKGTVIPVIRESCTLPAPFQTNPPIWIDLTDDKKYVPWDQLFHVCQTDLRTQAPTWLKARDELVRSLKQAQSVYFKISGGPKWLELLEEVRNTVFEEYKIELKIIDLNRGAKNTIHGLISHLFEVLNIATPIPKGEELPVFDRVFSNLQKPAFLVFNHFNTICNKRYYPEFYQELRYLNENRKIVLLLESRADFATLTPPNMQDSRLLLNQIELGGRP